MLTGLCTLALALLLGDASALTLDDLRTMPDLTPKRFAKLFRNFDYARHDEVQDPETFLFTRSGDCDDYATLAADILAERGYTTHLITVRTDFDAHVVCYVEETGSYLDYNHRSYFFFRTVRCSNSLEKIAKKVARSLRQEWTSVAEFEFHYGLKLKVREVTADGSTPEFETLLVKAAAPRPIIIDF